MRSYKKRENFINPLKAKVFNFIPFVVKRDNLKAIGYNSPIDCKEEFAIWFSICRGVRNSYFVLNRGVGMPAASTR